MDKNSPKTDLERVRGYIVKVLMSQFMHFGYDRQKVSQISQEVLQKTDQASTLEEIEAVLHQLAEEYPELRIAEVKEALYNAHMADSEKISQLLAKLQQNDIDGAVDLVHQYESGQQ